MSVTKLFAIRFGSGHPTMSAANPTFVVFCNPLNGATLSPPLLATLAVNPGMYFFTCAISTFPISFLVDGGASLVSSLRWIDGLIDPVASVGDRIGYASDAIGSTAVDPSTIYGHVKRSQEVLEGPATFDKSGGTWNVFARGATLLLFQRAFTNVGSTVTKS